MPPLASFSSARHRLRERLDVERLVLDAQIPRHQPRPFQAASLSASANPAAPGQAETFTANLKPLLYHFP